MLVLQKIVPATMRSGRQTPFQQAGFTLLELLVVIVILSMMLGLSAAAYWRTSRSFKEQGAASDLDVVLRQARNSAILANAPAFVEIDTVNRRVVPWAYRTVGLWHFENSNTYGKSTGAHHDAVLRGAEIFNDGKIGKCVMLKASGCVDVGAEPDFDCEDGGVLEAYIRPSSYSFGGDNYIFCKKDAYDLRIGSGGILIGNAGNGNVQAQNYHLVPGRWTKVAFAWDANSTRLLVDDGIVAIGPGSHPPITENPLLIGHESASFIGLVDEVRVMTVVRGNALELPRTYTLSHTATPWNAIYFSGDGTLDIRHHAGPVSVMLTQDRKARRVTVSMLGQTSRMEVENVSPVNVGK